MVKLDVEAAGADRLADTLHDAARDLDDLGDVNRAAAEDVLGYARVPRRTGLLASTAKVEPAAGIGFTAGYGSSRAYYAPFVHAVNPFLYEAWNRREQAVIDRYTDAAAAAVDQIRGD